MEILEIDRIPNDRAGDARIPRKQKRHGTKYGSRGKTTVVNLSTFGLFIACYTPAILLEFQSYFFIFVTAFWPIGLSVYR